VLKEERNKKSKDKTLNPLQPIEKKQTFPFINKSYIIRDIKVNIGWVCK
jgi:hypothetical protein